MEVYTSKSGAYTTLTSVVFTPCSLALTTPPFHHRQHYHNRYYHQHHHHQHYQNPLCHRVKQYVATFSSGGIRRGRFDRASRRHAGRRQHELWSQVCGRFERFFGTGHCASDPLHNVFTCVARANRRGRTVIIVVSLPNGESEFMWRWRVENNYCVYERPRSFWCARKQTTKREEGRKGGRETEKKKKRR